ncbi:hypothetical protein I350_07169 [Cryptococcus amylolentus CBS 6273]|uniref:Uncharacterized protein n=1 Tax=Cryptococcus amylolentus CBS 6273 TaxID=1296118 RepID=A0A1E3JDU7_9TREE|nr:hypothetical protein I350_07169 [Cryptococcus amylolentus CBS 6273]
MAQLFVDEIPSADPIYAFAPVGNTRNSSSNSDAGSNHHNPPSPSPSANDDGLYESSVPASRTVFSPNTWYDSSPYTPDDTPRDVAQYTLRPSRHDGEREGNEGGQLVDILISYRTETSDIERSIRIQVSEGRTRREEYLPWIGHVYDYGAVQDSAEGSADGGGAAEGGGEAGVGVVVPAGGLYDVVRTVYEGASEDELEDAEDNAREVLWEVYCKLHEW